MTHLVVIPSPGAGHLASAVEMAKLVVERDHRLSVTVLIMTYPTGNNRVSTALPATTASSSERLSFVDLSHDGFVPDTSKLPGHSFAEFIDHHKPQVRDLVEAATRSESTRLAGVVVDMFCTTMMDVAGEFGVPSYVFFTSGAGFLSLLYYGLEHELAEFKDSDTELAVPGYINSVPDRVLPITLMDGNWSTLFDTMIRRFNNAKGILVNTFLELESHAIDVLSKNHVVPPIFPVGPILDLRIDKDRNEQSEAIVGWLNNQPRSSVLFLCFGSRGCFDVDQVTELAIALERSGTRFLWSCRKPPPKGSTEFPKDYEDVAEILPNGFLERTKEIGKVIGWAPQVAVLSHPAVGGFVSHCGWNSTLESLWYGVPIATWPFYAEQQLNAFQLVKELGLAAEIKMDYKASFAVETEIIVTAKEIENGIRQLMDATNNSSSSIKLKVKEMSEKSKAAVTKNGSSYVSLGRFLEDVIGIV